MSKKKVQKAISILKKNIYFVNRMYLFMLNMSSAVMQSIITFMLLDGKFLSGHGLFLKTH